MHIVVEHLRRRAKRSLGPGDESGMTLIELMVAMAAGLIVFGAITALMLMTLRQSGRVTSHVEANQRARTTMTKIVNELHSACFFPQVKPVREGSEGNKLTFWHQSGSAVRLTPVQSTIALVNGELVQYDEEPLPGGGGNAWSFPFTGGSEEPLMKGIAPIEEPGSIFTYYTYSNGKLVQLPVPPEGGLKGSTAATVVQVGIAFRAAPEPPIAEDENSATAISNSVSLRLTPPSYNASAVNPPCE